MKIRLAFALAVLLVGDAYGQAAFQSYPSGVTQADVDAAVRPQRSQRANVTSAADGTWSVTWANTFQSATPIVIPTPIGAGALPADCNVTARSATSASGKCWQQTTALIAVLGLTLTVPPSNFAGPVMVLGIEPSQ